MDQSTTNNRGGKAALSNIRVVELAEHDAGASCGEFLAWYGADVVKVEPPGGASSRHATTEKPGVDSCEFILLNANKRSVACDLQSEGGRQDLRTLIASADVVVEHLNPGAARRLGFDYEGVRKINPHIVFAVITGFGPASPCADYLVDDSVAQSVGGAASLTGYLGG